MAEEYRIIGVPAAESATDVFNGLAGEGWVYRSSFESFGRALHIFSRPKSKSEQVTVQYFVE